MATTQASRRNRKTNAASLPRSAPLASSATIGDLLKRLGQIPAERVRLRPSPGTATEKDVLDVLNRENVPCELVEGTLVEKAMGYEESEIAGLLLTFLNIFVRPRKLGIVTGADGTIRLFRAWSASRMSLSPLGDASPTGSGPRLASLNSLPTWSSKS